MTDSTNEDGTKCSVCGKSLFEYSIVLYRNAPLGEICKDWRCWEHLEDKYRQQAEHIRSGK